MRAPAKINLTLEVLASRGDGYHGVRSVMVPLDLADELTIEPSSRFSFECDRDELTGQRNLAVAALHALGEELPAVRMRLFKRIPVQAGLGGGSSDAAAVLRAAMAGAFGPAPRREWMQIARNLGSDVPFFLAGTAALVEGTGERVTPAGAIPTWNVLIVKPPVDVSTAQAYREIDATKRPQRPRSECVSIAMLEALQRAEFPRVQELLQNDFHDVITGSNPEVRIALDALRVAGASNALLAGSGSCVFALSPEKARIEAIARRLALPPRYEHFVTRFATTPEWR
ncbi:MAG: 4-(cytidine 5'-diphospho)-2-C-methyl-D-erythritol kinase [Candidatus Cybelea sp.]